MRGQISHCVRLDQPLAEPLEARRLLSAITNWSSRGPGGGGAFFSPSFSPYNSRELYTVSDMSGLYHTTNLGQSWTMASSQMIQGGIGSSVQFTSNPNILYTLDYSDNSSGGSSTAPTMSTNGGAIWQQVSGWNGSDDQAYSLFANPASTSQLLVSDYGNLFFSSNSGASFTQVFTDTSGAGCYIGGVYWNDANIFVGTDMGLLVSTNGGASFALSTATGLPAGSSILSFAGATSGGVTRLACITANSGDVYAGLEMGSIPSGSYSGVWTITPDNASWTKATTIPSDDGPLIISMAQNDINDIYLGGTDYSTSDPIIAKSTDGGHTFTDVLNTTNNGNVITGWQGSGGDRGWSFDQLTEGFEVDPANSNYLAFTGYGFLHLSTNGGQSWQQAYVTTATENPAGSPTPQDKAYQGVGLEDTSTLYLNWASPQIMNAGYTDIYGVHSADGGQTWSFPAGISLAGNTVYCIIEDGSTLYAATSDIHDIYQSTHVKDSTLNGGTGNIIYSTDNGATWNVLHSFSKPCVWVAIDPNDPNRLYASVASNLSGGIYTTDTLSSGTSATWSECAAPPRTAGHAFNIDVLNDGTVVATFSGQYVGSSFTDSSGVFISTNHGSSWTDRTGTGMNWWTKDITVDPTDPTQNTWYASVRFAYGTSGASGTGGLYRTTNRGVTWTEIFQSIGAESAAINPSTGEMYVATEESGLYYSANPKAANPTFTLTNYPFRQPERIFFDPYDSNQVWITSFGYGLVVGTSTSPLTITTSNAYIKLDPDGQHMDVWNSNTATGTLTQYLLSEVVSVTYAAPAGNDDLVLDFSDGNPLPASGLTYTGGTGQNDLSILGTTSSDSSVALNISAGTVTVAPSTGSGFNAITLGALDIAVGAKLVLAAPSAHANRSVLTLGTLSIAGITNSWQGSLDLTENDLVIHNGNLPQITNQIAAGYSNGSWTGQGVSSSSAATLTNHLTALGAIQNNQSGAPLFTATNPFDGTIPGTSDILVKYTYYGDTNLNGKVDGSDYSLIDNGYLDKLSGWYNGDFNYDGVVDGSDYTLIDNAFNMQGASLAAMVTAPAVQVATVSRLTAVPTGLFSTAQITPPAWNLDEIAGVVTKSVASSLLG